jgi:glycerate 2-kinase
VTAVHPSQLLRTLFDHFVDAADPARVLGAHLPDDRRSPLIVIGAGKASAAMAAALESAWQGPLTGLVVTRYGHGAACRSIEVLESGHPLPDSAGASAASRMLARVSGLGTHQRVICLLSGGGSALLALPPPAITFAQKRDINAALLRSGATIGEINCVRKHLSAIKGGRLGVACAPARLLTLAISDVPGDDPAVIASGPTVGDATTSAQATDILRRYAIETPPAVHTWLASADSESIKPGDPRLAHTEYRLVATPAQSLAAAADAARAAGIAPLVLGADIEGEARDVAQAHAALALRIRAQGDPLPAPCVILSGGETTVTVRGNGRGGRNTEYLLALACALGGADNLYALACDSDGIDGTQDNAGALLLPEHRQRATELGIDAHERLNANDAYAFFAALKSLVVTGPTRTNVNDFRAVLVMPA